MSEPYKFVKVQHYMINVCHVISVKKRPDPSQEKPNAWTLEIETSKDSIKLERYAEAEVHEMFGVFERLLTAQ